MLHGSNCLALLSGPSCAPCRHRTVVNTVLQALERLCDTLSLHSMHCQSNSTLTSSELSHILVIILVTRQPYAQNGAGRVRQGEAAAVAAYFGIAASLWVFDSVHLAVMLLELNVLEAVCSRRPRLGGAIRHGMFLCVMLPPC